MGQLRTHSSIYCIKNNQINPLIPNDLIYKSDFFFITTLQIFSVSNIKRDIKIYIKHDSL